MRFLGIDYGSKRVGIALSDEGGQFALPREVLKNDKDLLHDAAKICSEHDVKEIVLGESTNFDGEPNLIMKDIIVFKKALEERLRLPVYLEPEFMTSAEAERLQRQPVGESRRSGLNLRKPQEKIKNLDSSAAAIILKSYLDKHSQL